MIAQSPFEFDELTMELRVDQLCTFLAKLAVSEAGEKRDLQKLELTWQKGKFILRSIHKIREEEMEIFDEGIERGSEVHP